MIDKHKPIVGYPFAAPLSGKDTAERGLTQARPHISVIHMSTLLQVVIHQNDHYKKLVQEGGLLPPEEAVRAFRRGFLEITSKITSTKDLPHIFANGACREEYETKANIAMVKRLQGSNYQQVGFRFLLDKEHIKSRASERVQQAIRDGKKPRPDDLGDTPVTRYNTFHKNLGPVLKVFEAKGGTIIDIDANETPEQVLSQIVTVYDSVKLHHLIR